MRMRRAVWRAVGVVLVLTATGCAAPLGRAYERTSTGRSFSATHFQAVRAEAEAPSLSRRWLPVQEVVEAAAARCGSREEEELERHNAYVFLGYTFERGNGGASVGLSYEYHLDEQFGAAVFVDYVFGDVSAWAFGAVLTIRPWRTEAWRGSPLRGLTFLLGPGGELVRERDEEGALERELAFLFRVGALYDIELGRGFTVAPTAYVDFIAPDERAYVIGFEFGKEF